MTDLSNILVLQGNSLKLATNKIYFLLSIIYICYLFTIHFPISSFLKIKLKKKIPLWFDPRDNTPIALLPL